jgi:membrane protein insertase Oxa1/YidC/SpoIIIJ
MNIILKRNIKNYILLIKSQPSVYQLSNLIRCNSTSTPNIEKANLITDTVSSDYISNKISIFSDSPITDVCTDLIISLHDQGVFEWSSTIMISALLFRLSVCFPIKVYQEKLVARMINIQPKIQETIENRFKDINLKSRFINDEIKRKMNADLIRIRNALYLKENCSPQKIPIASLIQMPFWIYLSASIRNLTAGFMGHPGEMEQIRNESFVWLTSLATSDPTFILPALYATFALANLKYASLTNLSSGDRGGLSKIFSFRKYLTLTFIVILTVLIANLPAVCILFS